MRLYFQIRLHLKKLGFNENYKITSNENSFIIPSKGTTKIRAKSLNISEVIKGEISTIYSESFPLKTNSFFRLILKIDEEDLTTIFLGSEYSCGSTHYALGLINLEIENSHYQVYRHKKGSPTFLDKHKDDKTTFLIIESLEKVVFDKFKLICESALKSIGFLTGNWHQNENYFFAYDSVKFEFPNSIFYTYFGDSVISNFEIINPQQFRSFIHNESEEYPLLTPLLFPEKTLSEMIVHLKSKPEFERAVELIIDGNEIASPLIRCSVFSVALETMVSLIHSENKSFFKPLKREQKIASLLGELQAAVDKSKNELNDEEYGFLSKKITYLNTPFNKDKYLLAFDFFNIDLPDRLKKILDTRNLYFHGKTPYKEGELKSKIKDLHLEADRLHLLVSILILKYANYRGHIKNQAGYRLAMKEHFDEIDLQLSENAFYTI